MPLPPTFRALLRTPAFTLIVIGIVALGIAGNTAIFSIYNALFLRPLPFPDSERLVYLDERAPKWNLKFVSIAYPDFVSWRSQNRLFDSMAVWKERSWNLSGHGDSQRIKGAAVTFDLARTLRVRPIVGREFTPEEDRPNGAKVVLIAHGLWRSMFSSDRNVIGKILELDGVGHTIVGVLPPEALFPSEAQFWVPLAADPNEQNGWYLQGIGRLKATTTGDQALTNLTAIHKNMIPQRKVNEITFPIVMPLRERYLGDYRTISLILLGGVAVVLLIACVNVAGMMLARGTQRAREISIRAALGAGRKRIIRHILTESLMLAVAGGALGVLLGSWSLQGLLGLMGDQFPQWILFNLDFRFAAFAIAVTCVCALLFGMAPALQASRVDVGAVLQASTTRTSAGSGKRRSLKSLVAGEVALALVLLIGAGLLVQAFRKIRQVDLGFRPENVLTYRISLPNKTYKDESQWIQFFEQLLERQRAMPGVVAAGAVSAPPLGGHWGNFYEVEGAVSDSKGEDPVILTRVATTGYFEAMGIKLAAGRAFLPSDGRKGNLRAGMVDETFAKRFWPGQPAGAVGRRIRFRGSKQEWITVVGVARDVKHYGADKEVRPGVYFPHTMVAQDQLTVVVRTVKDPTTLLSAAREAVRQMDPSLPLFQTQTMMERVEQSFKARRAYSWLFGVFAVVALILAAAGLYGVISYTVTQRTHEIGIRMALGAQQNQVLGQVLREGLLLVAIGTAAGLVATIASMRLLKSLLFEVSPYDPVVYVALSAALIGVALLANYVPARRAARTDPMRALRFE